MRYFTMSIQLKTINNNSICNEKLLEYPKHEVKPRSVII